MAKIRVDWEKLREFPPDTLLELERELFEAIRREWEERRAARLQDDESSSERRRRKR